jgi:hypothetical protein
MKIIEWFDDSQTKSIKLKTPEQEKALVDTCPALGLQEEEQGMSTRSDLLERFKSLENVAVVINYALSLSRLDRPALRARILDCWQTLTAFKAIAQLSQLPDDSFRRTAIYCFAKYRFGPIAEGSPYAALLDESGG